MPFSEYPDELQAMYVGTLEASRRCFGRPLQFAHCVACRLQPRYRAVTTVFSSICGRTLPITDHERQYIHRRIGEERMEIEKLSCPPGPDHPEETLNLLAQRRLLEGNSSGASK